jgi:hypothetical protein
MTIRSHPNGAATTWRGTPVVVALSVVLGAVITWLRALRVAP